MKFGYSYRASDGVRHEAVFVAKTKEEVFASLRERGIKPMKVWPIYSRFHVSKGTVAIVVLVLALVAVLAFSRSNVSSLPSISFSSIARRQIWGDDAIIDAAVASNWREVFENPAERLLALFAQPGRAVKVPVTSAGLEESFRLALAKPTPFAEGDLDEFKQMKCIVAGMKDELREYLADGGTLQTYLVRLVERQNAEIQLLEYERRQLEEMSKRGDSNLPRLWREANLRLRSRGLPAIPQP